jgi:hypothetical protein
LNVAKKARQNLAGFGVLGDARNFEAGNLNMATSQVETVSTGADKAKLGTAAVALVIASVAGFYLLGKQGPIVQWGALLVGLVAAAVFLVSPPGGSLLPSP